MPGLQAHLVYVVLEMKPRALCVLGKELYQLPQPEGEFIFVFYFEIVHSTFYFELFQINRKLRIREPQTLFYHSNVGKNSLFEC